MGDPLTAALVIGLKTIGIAGVPTWLASGAASLLSTTLLTSLAARLNRPKASDVREQLRLSNELPPYRFAWGPGTRVPGTPWYMGEKNGVRYFAYLLNSRPSDTSGFTLRLDGRPVALSGDPFEFGPLTRGTATVAEGETQVTITHGFGALPQTLDAYAENLVAVVDMVDATSFRATIPDPAPAGGLELTWVCTAATPGAVATNDPFVGHLEVWVQDGSQEHPPTKLLVENGDQACGNGEPPTAAQLTENRLWHTDKFHGLTVVWLRMTLGNAESRRERWPNAIPNLDATMGWSKVWDPTDEEQDPDDPATWTASGNVSRCLLDCARFNPVAQWPMGSINLAMFEWGTEVDNTPIPLKAGGTRPQYRVGGVQTFGGRELPDILAELAEAGGGELLTVGGRLGYRPGCWVDPDVTLTRYYQEGKPTFQRDRDRTAAPQAVRVIYSDPGAEWEDATFEPALVSEDWGGDESRVLTLSLPLVSDPYQAMRLQQQEARRQQLGRSLENVVFPPNPAADLIATATVALNLPATTWRNGTYRLTGKDGLYFLGDPATGVAMRVKLSMQEDSEYVWAWNPETDELDYEEAPTEVLDLSLGPPTSVNGTFEGGGTSLRIQFSAVGYYLTDPNLIWVPAPGITGYGWEWQRDGQDWFPGSLVSAGPPVCVASLPGTQDQSSYLIRVRSLAEGRASAWAYGGPFQNGFDLGAPTGVSATAGTAEITIDATSPDDSDHDRLEYWGADADTPYAAELLATQTVAQDTADSFTETGLATGVTRFYFVRSITATGAAGPFAPTVSAAAA